MKPLQIRRIRTQAEKYFQHIDTSDILNDKITIFENKRISRALAALGLDILTNHGIEACGSHVVDEYSDNGIDGLIFDRKNKTLVIVQSKWINDGAGGPDLAGTLKFIKGVKNLISNGSDNLGRKGKRFTEEVTSALDDPDVKIVISLIFTGDSISSEVNSAIEEFLDSDSYEDTIKFIPLYGKNLVDKAADIFKSTQITIELLIEQWGMIQNDQNMQAIYGQVACSDIAELYKNHGERLTDENIRKFLGETSINKKIKDSLVGNPAEFIYLNNGIAITCKNLKKKPLGGNNRDSGVFIAENAQIVNGAQTFSCIASVASNKNSNIADSKVFVRVISTNRMNENFSKTVTQATNNQNKIDKKDFASIDNIQTNLRSELALLDIQYIIKSGELRSDLFKNQTSFEEAVTALACSSGNVTYAILAKREIGKLWENLDSPPYTDLFTKDLLPITLWKKVQIHRKIQESIKINNSKISVYADKIINFIFFETLEKYYLHNPDKDVNDLDFAGKVEKIVLSLTQSQIDLHKEAMLSRLFYNQEKTISMINKSFVYLGIDKQIIQDAKSRKKK